MKYTFPIIILLVVNSSVPAQHTMQISREEFQTVVCVATSPDGMNWYNRRPININTNYAGFPGKEHRAVDCPPHSSDCIKIFLLIYCYNSFVLSPGSNSSPYIFL